MLLLRDYCIVRIPGLDLDLHLDLVDVDTMSCHRMQVGHFNLLFVDRPSDLELSIFYARGLLYDRSCFDCFCLGTQL